VLVIAPPSARSAEAPDPRALEAVQQLVEAGAHPRKAASVVASLTGTSANALYRALTSE
jgi:16S rRNA (cytidine1402-2'-O)-methyltransferase